MEEKHLIPMDISPISLFQGKKLLPFLAKVKKAVDDFVPDAESPKGRKEIGTFANKISTTKTAIEKAGKSLVEKQKAELALIDADRKLSRDFLDAERDRVLEPRKTWQEAEDKRIEEEERKIRVKANHAEALEFHALWLKKQELEALKQKILMEAEKKAEEEEAARIKQEEIEREDRIKKEAAEKAKKEAEEAAEREIKKAKEAVEKAERDKIAAKEKADREKQEAVDRTIREANERAVKVKSDTLRKEAKEKAEKESERIAAKKKAANLNHKRRIDREVIASFVGVGWPEAEAEHIAGSIAGGEISHVTINY